eukprot:CAMPEP_0168738116 /NCGR_PEP_ID=MMETSP0724-20121128/10761_1 /TAXON_ID=265536 /ORGANISM="Amphiprora sp., Strain CCMP467" /LENGTH=592 /DNA_ID=CAMNT_0008785437 /DNA_START=133 /DNA_END=1911 /DNA_ORIENTATION=+
MSVQPFRKRATLGSAPALSSTVIMGLSSTTRLLLPIWVLLFSSQFRLAQTFSLPQQQRQPGPPRPTRIVTPPPALAHEHNKNNDDATASVARHDLPILSSSSSFVKPTTTTTNQNSDTHGNDKKIRPQDHGRQPLPTPPPPPPQQQQHPKGPRRRKRRQNYKKTVIWSAIQAAAKKGRPEQVQRLLNEMQAWQQQQQQQQQQTNLTDGHHPPHSYNNNNNNNNDDDNWVVVAYSMLVHAWSQSGRVEAPHRAETVVRRMIHLYRQGRLGRAPDVVTYTSLISCWARHAKVVVAQQRQRQQRQRQRRRRNDDDKDNNNGYSPQRQRQQTNAGPPTEPTLRPPPPPPRVTPRQAAARAQGILQEMQRQYFTTGNARIKPNLQTYTAVISAWERSLPPIRQNNNRHHKNKNNNHHNKNPMSRNQQLTQRRRQVQQAEALEHVESLLQEMHHLGYSTLYNPQRHDCGDTCRVVVISDGDRTSNDDIWVVEVLDDDWTVRPDVSTYNAVLRTIAKCCHVERATPRTSRSSGTTATSTTPKLRSYQNGKARTPSLQVEKAAFVLKQMQFYGVKPNRFTRQAIALCMPPPPKRNKTKSN